MRYQLDGSDQKKLEPFFEALVKLARFTAEDKQMQRGSALLPLPLLCLFWCPSTNAWVLHLCSVRLYGLKAITNLVLYNDAQRSVSHLDELVPAILLNLPQVFPFQQYVSPLRSGAASSENECACIRLCVE
jgi:hypothetical protein